jgi:hypothetical protein
MQLLPPFYSMENLKMSNLTMVMAMEALKSRFSTVFVFKELKEPMGTSSWMCSLAPTGSDELDSWPARPNWRDLIHHGQVFPIIFSIVHMLVIFLTNACKRYVTYWLREIIYKTANVGFAELARFLLLTICCKQPILLLFLFRTIVLNR